MSIKPNNSEPNFKSFHSLKKKISIDKCIYCGSAGKLTKEHIFGKWMKAHLKDQNYTKHMQARLMDENVGVLGRGSLAKSNNISDDSLRIVCSSCNNGWMSTIQNKAKNIIPNLMRHKWILNTPDDVLSVAQWCTMVAISFQFATPDMVSLSFENRKRFMDTLCPPSGMKIYCGFSFYENGTTLNWYRPAQIDPHLNGEKFNAFTFICRLEGFFFYCTFVEEPYDKFQSGIEFINVRKIWPLPLGSLVRPDVMLPDDIVFGSQQFWEDLGGELHPPLFGMYHNVE